jgi:hypothetical protein
MKAVFFIALFCCLTACQKPSERACWKGAGEKEKRMVPLSKFNYLDLQAHIELVLVQDSLDFLEWEAGANTQAFLAAEWEADTLHLRNNNRCKFLRYQNGGVKATLHFTEFAELHLANSEQVSNQGSWVANELLLFLKEGVGKVQLQVALDKLTIRNNYGWQNAQLSGSCNALFVDFDGSASLQAPSLMVQDSISFRSSSPLSSHIWADQILLKAQLYGPGNLYYSGTPSTLLKSEYNAGKVVPN